jgi:tRNA-Thr(GGU) m(6)t(6)A37 methyltransferase TsaA
LKLKPIARVENGVTETPEDWDRVVSRLVFDRKYLEGLKYVDHFRHLWILFGFHRMRKTMLTVRPMRNPDNPEVGVFASHSPTRPNKIGMTKSRLLKVDGNILTVKGLDAFDGSPVFDIKPPDEEIDYRPARRARKSR